jgi:uncharacterized protein (DUF1697 family)
VEYVAFLGGINVGGHRITMDHLRGEFESLGFDGVRTFIASGNVVFSASGRRTTLEATIEHHLEARLGYPVPTFVRSGRAVVEIVARAPFGPPAAGDSHFVGFLRKAPSASSTRATEALSNDQDRFEVHGTELHWLVHGGMSDTSVKSSVLAKAIGVPFTTRNTTSLRKLAATL